MKYQTITSYSNLNKTAFNHQQSNMIQHKHKLHYKNIKIIINIINN